MIKILLLFFLSNFSIYSFAQHEPLSEVLPASSEFESLLNIKFTSGILSGFVVADINSKFHIVTAKHAFNTTFKKQIRIGKKNVYQYYDSCVYKDGDVITFSIRKNDVWETHKGILELHTDPLIDIALIKIDFDLQINHTLNFDNTSICLLGQDVFFMGYPLGLFLGKDIQNFYSNSMPLIRKGILSGSQVDDHKNGLFIIDGHNTKGFSGGPVIYWDYKLKKFVLLGVISGYLKQENVIYNEDGTVTKYYENSGVLEGYRAVFINQIIKQHI